MTAQELPAARAATVEIRDAIATDAAAIAGLYNQGIAERQATFETRPRDREEIAGWFEPDLPFLVAELGGRVIGFARVSPYSDRCVYRGVGAQCLPGGGAPLEHVQSARLRRAGLLPRQQHAETEERR